MARKEGKSSGRGPQKRGAEGGEGGRPCYHDNNHGCRVIIVIVVLRGIVPDSIEEMIAVVVCFVEARPADPSAAAAATHSEKVEATSAIVTAEIVGGGPLFGEGLGAPSLMRASASTVAAVVRGARCAILFERLAMVSTSNDCRLRNIFRAVMCRNGHWSFAPNLFSSPADERRCGQWESSRRTWTTWSSDLKSMRSATSSRSATDPDPELDPAATCVGTFCTFPSASCAFGRAAFAASPSSSTSDSAGSVPGNAGA
eukprot:CAMPEP_0206581908 /NCGR_PEP_ID=MMETSP0325_2-20121206/34141_1 /ASSEMBLY_ACC=CAM_ASM_000347 /TAXON_ID=2866 /ORGANISM="Crypthecodinium cohnii, Strain Seligo" /LENGTH=256 /DNA_ID=CAMNT_0054088433 /DNA_START=76 /DNA_END=848 /DNA_ORIENTATION=-